MLSLTRTVTFRASHFLRLANLSDTENRARFGATVAPHSHDYRCSVTVSGPPMPGLGSVIDLVELDRILEEELLRPFAGASLNEALPPVARGEALAVGEVLAAWCFERIAPRLPAGVRLERVRIAEDDILHADCTGLA